MFDKLSDVNRVKLADLSSFRCFSPSPKLKPKSSSSSRVNDLKSRSHASSRWPLSYRGSLRLRRVRERRLWNRLREPNLRTPTGFAGIYCHGISFPKDGFPRNVRSRILWLTQRILPEMKKKKVRRKVRNRYQK
jgi:hypothetical protein